MTQRGATPATGFDDPVRILSDAHRQTERFLESALEVAQNAGGHLSAEDRGPLVAALRHFSHASHLHTRDEEESLFPRLRAHADKLRVQAALETLEQLDREHQAAREIQAKIELLGHRWLTESYLSEESRASLVTVLESLQELYRTHTLTEETFLYPLALEVLSPAELERLGLEMQERHTS